MMPMFTTIKQVPSDFFNKVAFDSGVLVKNWDKTDPFADIADADIIAATTGDFNISSKPSVIDLFEDVNGVPNGSKEGVFVESWEHTIGVTAINTSLDVIKYALGVADVDTTAGSVTPRRGLAESSDFVHLTWIGQTVDGGLVVADLTQAMSVEGLEITTGKNTKGQFPLTIKGFYSIEDPDESPVTYYVIEAAESGVSYEYTAATPVGTENPSEEGWYVLVGDKYRATNDTTVDDNVTYYIRSTTT